MVFLITAILTAGACSSTDSRIVYKPFKQLEWVERTRSPVAYAMAERHFRFCAPLRHAVNRAADAFNTAQAEFEAGEHSDINRLFRLKSLYERYRRDLIANLWEVLFFKPDHRPALLEIVSLLEETWYVQTGEVYGLEIEMANLVELEKALRLSSDFFGRDYEVNYKLGVVLYREGNIIKHIPELASAVNEASPPTSEERFLDAKFFLRKCIAVRSMYAEAYQLLAFCLEEEGKDKEAYKFWKLITVIEQAYERERADEPDSLTADIFEMAHGKVKEYEKEYGVL